MVTNHYRWRGIGRSDHFNGQLRGVVRFDVGAVRINVGGWTNIELGAHRDSSRTDLGPGKWGPSELDGWLEVSHAESRLAVAAGVIGYHYRGPQGNAETAEIYLRLRATGRRGVRFVPELSLYYDPIERQAGYLEASVSTAGLALPFVQPVAFLYAGLAGGVALGRARGAPTLRARWFDRSGFAFGEASTGVRLRTGLFLVNLAGQLVYGNDPATRRRGSATPALRSRLQPMVTFEAGLTLPRLSDR